MKTLFFATTLVIIGTLCHAGPDVRKSAREDFDRADADLNVCYKKVIAAVSNDKMRRDVSVAEQAWLKYRDAEAAARAGVTSQGGSAYTTDYLANLTELTRQRVSQLNQLLKLLSP